MNSTERIQSPITKLDWAIVAFSVGFMLVLAESAYFEREVLWLHVFQSLIYVAIIVLSLRHNTWGYAIAIAIATLWNTFNVFSGFFAGGIRAWSSFIQTGTIEDPVLLVSPLAGLDHVALMVCVIWAYLRLDRKSWRDMGVLAATYIGVTAYFLAIIALFWSDFLPRMWEILFG